MRSAVWSSSLDVVAVGKYRLENMVLRSTNGGLSWTRPQLVGALTIHCRGLDALPGVTRDLSIVEITVFTQNLCVRNVCILFYTVLLRGS